MISKDAVTAIIDIIIPPSSTKEYRAHSCTMFEMGMAAAVYEPEYVKELMNRLNKAKRIPVELDKEMYKEWADMFPLEKMEDA